MTTIDVCKTCENRKFDASHGIVCRLTDEKPNFTDECPHFKIDENVQVYRSQPLRSNEKRASIALLLIWIVTGLEFLSLVSSVMQYNLLQFASHGGEVTVEAANANNLREQMIAIVYLVAFIISAITFILWFRRAYFNLHQKVRNLSFSEGWAAGSWFVPIVNLYRPLQIMRELYGETTTYIANRNSSIKLDLTTKLLGIWWTLWLVNGFLGRMIFNYSRHADTISDLITSTTMEIASALFGIILGFVTVKIIRDYSNLERILETEA